MEDAEELSMQEQLKAEHRCPFVRKEVIGMNATPLGGKENLFWCSRRFGEVLSIPKTGYIRQNIVERLPVDCKIEGRGFARFMLHFRVDTTGWASSGNWRQSD